MKSKDLQYVKDTLLELDPEVTGLRAQSYNTALVVLSALTCGPNVQRLAAFTGLSQDFVAAIRARMVQAELWTELDVFSDHWNVAEGVVNTTAFWLDVLIAEGLAVRRWDEGVGDYRYRAAEHALNSNAAAK